MSIDNLSWESSYTKPRIEAARHWHEFIAGAEDSDALARASRAQIIGLTMEVERLPTAPLFTGFLGWAMLRPG